MLKKKLNNKGFTLAELLVVIAILAILIAIAIPVFSGMVADANLRVNQANIRSVRSAGVAHILTRLDETDSGGTTKLNAGLASDAGWLAFANVDNNGDVTNLEVYVVESGIGGYENGIAIGDIAGSATGLTGLVALSDDTTDEFATLRPTTDASGVYTVQAVIKDLDPVT